MPTPLSPDIFGRARDLAQRWVETDQATALAWQVGNGDDAVFAGQQGYSDLGRSRSLKERPVFLVASITKPVLVLGALQMVERGLLTLGDRVIDWIPEFGQHGKSGVEIRHLLTHTSGLPDMLPENRELRVDHAPLSTFVERTGCQPLSFPPGRGVQYQSMGLAVLAEIMLRAAGRPAAAWLREELFAPLGMSDSYLGLPAEWLNHDRSGGHRLVDVRIPADQVDGPSWNWNSPYWLQLGAPWGGLLSTVDDLAALARCLLRQGRNAQGQPILAPETVRQATINQLHVFRDLPEVERRTRPWGFGWRMNWPNHTATFGDLLSEHAYGHWGATGTVMWIDPARDRYAVILSSQPQDGAGYFLVKLSNILAAV